MRIVSYMDGETINWCLVRIGRPSSDMLTLCLHDSLYAISYAERKYSSVVEIESSFKNMHNLLKLQYSLFQVRSFNIFMSVGLSYFIQGLVNLIIFQIASFIFSPFFWLGNARAVYTSLLRCVGLDYTLHKSYWYWN